MSIRPIASLASLAFALSLCACASNDSATDSAESGGATAANEAPPATGITQPGAQDFGLFRDILTRGEIPAPDTIDDRGFFAEHKLDYPLPDCGNDVCMHPLVGTMGNMISGANCTLLQIGLNSPIDVSTQPRPPLDLVVTIDVSGSMKGDPIGYVRAGLLKMIDALDPADKLSLVRFSDRATIVLDSKSLSQRAEIEKAIDDLEAAGSTNLYDGLATGLALAASHAAPEAQRRVIFLSDGEATVGVESNAKLRSLAGEYARQGVSISSIGVGKDFDVDAMRSIGEVGAGNFYFLDDPAAVREVFADEVKTALYPVASDVRIRIDAGDGYRIRGVYGTRGWEGGERGGDISIASLFLARRLSSSDPIGSGRRGGGGAIIVELIPTGSATVSDPKGVGSVVMRYRKPGFADEITQEAKMSSPYNPDEVPAEGYFSEKTAAKGFVMLNLYAGFRLAAELSRDGDVRSARGTLEALHRNVSTWLSANPDADVKDDLYYVQLFVDNLKREEAKNPALSQAPAPVPQNPWPRD